LIDDILFVSVSRPIQANERSKESAMIAGIGLLALALLLVVAVAARKRGRSGGQVAMLMIVGVVAVILLMFAVLSWGFSGFG
jgi:hypothetical protein